MFLSAVRLFLVGFLVPFTDLRRVGSWRSRSVVSVSGVATPGRVPVSPPRSVPFGLGGRVPRPRRARSRSVQGLASDLRVRCRDFLSGLIPRGLRTHLVGLLLLRVCWGVVRGRGRCRAVGVPAEAGRGGSCCHVPYRAGHVPGCHSDPSASPPSFVRSAPCAGTLCRQHTHVWGCCDPLVVVRCPSLSLTLS